MDQTRETVGLGIQFLRNAGCGGVAHLDQEIVVAEMHHAANVSSLTSLVFVWEDFVFGFLVPWLVSWSLFCEQITLQIQIQSPSEE